MPRLRFASLSDRLRIRLGFDQLAPGSQDNTHHSLGFGFALGRTTTLS